jgi:hypothetical protein
MGIVFQTDPEQLGNCGILKRSSFQLAIRERRVLSDDHEIATTNRWSGRRFDKGRTMSPHKNSRGCRVLLILHQYPTQMSAGIPKGTKLGITICVMRDRDLIQINTTLLLRSVFTLRCTGGA